MLIFKICHRAEWEVAEREGVYHGSPKDSADGFLHFSKADQLPGTLSRYYAGGSDLVLVAVEASDLQNDLRFEASRDGALFPHLYGSLPLSAVRWTAPIGLNNDGTFTLPDEAGT